VGLRLLSISQEDLLEDLDGYVGLQQQQFHRFIVEVEALLELTLVSALTLASAAAAAAAAAEQAAPAALVVLALGAVMYDEAGPATTESTVVGAELVLRPANTGAPAEGVLTEMAVEPAKAAEGGKIQQFGAQQALDVEEVTGAWVSILCNAVYYLHARVQNSAVCWECVLA